MAGEGKEEETLTPWKRGGDFREKAAVEASRAVRLNGAPSSSEAMPETIAQMNVGRKEGAEGSPSLILENPSWHPGQRVGEFPYALDQ